MAGPSLAKAAAKVGLKEINASGLVAALPSSLPMFGMFDQMASKEMVFDAAFEVGAARSPGGHLAYLGSVERELIVLMLIAKMFAGVLAIVLCIFTADFSVRKGMESRGDKPGQPQEERDEPKQQHPMEANSDDIRMGLLGPDDL
jgi:ethanolamine transporter EutH